MTFFILVHPTKCVNPGIPKSGFRVGEVFSYGATVEYFCNPGFRITAGNRLRRCQKNEKWTGSLPICEGMYASLWSHSTLCIEEPFFACVCFFLCFDLNPMLPFQTVFFYFVLFCFFLWGGGRRGCSRSFSKQRFNQLKNAFVNLTKPEMMVIVMCSRPLILWKPLLVKTDVNTVRPQKHLSSTRANLIIFS